MPTAAGVGELGPGADADGQGRCRRPVRGLDAGADDYLVKPFSLLELAARPPRLLADARATARLCLKLALRLER